MKPIRPEFPRPTKDTYGSGASLFLQSKTWSQYDLDKLVELGVLTEQDVEAVAFHASPLLSAGSGGIVMPCRVGIPTVIWEKIAAWQQRPHRELDPKKPEFHEALAEQAGLLHGKDSPAVRRCLERADELRDKPVTDPARQKVRIARELDQIENVGDTALLLQSDDERKDAVQFGKVQRLIERE